RVLVKRLADTRLIVTSVNQATEREEVEVAHEALIRYWRRLRKWLDEDRATLRLRDGVREAARNWADAPKDETLLVHRGPRLLEAEKLRKHPLIGLNKLEQEYIEACVSLRERERIGRERRRMSAVVGLSIGVLVASVLCIIAVIGWNEA